MMEYISTSEKQTQEIAGKIAKQLNVGDVVLLQGDLGAGKTAFVKGIVKSFGGKAQEVTSPTFTIVNTYALSKVKIYHFDLYRIENPEELFNIGIEEYLYGDGICFVEWPERAMSLLPEYSKQITIEKLDQNKRKIIFGENK